LSWVIGLGRRIEKASRVGFEQDGLTKKSGFLEK